MIEREARDIPGLTELQAIFSNLPLERCSFEQNPVTKEWGWHAPKGFAFKVTGQFVVDSIGSDIVYRTEPQESVDLLKARNPKEFHVLLAKFEGDEKQTIEALRRKLDYEPGVEAPESFVGKWLILDFPYSGKVYVKAEIEAWYNSGDNNRLLHNITPNTEKKTTVFVADDTVGFEVWEQYFAEGSLGLCKIEFIEIEEKEPELYVPPTDQSKVELTVARLGEEVAVSRESPKGKEWSFDPKLGAFVLGRGPSDLVIVAQYRGVHTAKSMDDPEIGKLKNTSVKLKKGGKE